MENNILDRISNIDDVYNDFLTFDIKNLIEPNFLYDYSKYIDVFKIREKEIYDNAEKANNGQIVLNIGIFGTFNTGKSSIINSILNEKILLDDVSPSTALVSILKYGDSKEMILCNKNGEKKEITEDEFYQVSNHHQEDSQEEGQIKENIDYIEVYYPCEVLRNINLIDTPGFSSVSEEDDNLTKKWLEYVDILLWTFDINKGTIHRDELNLLKYVSSKIGSKRIIAILNKIDRKPLSEREKLLNAFKKEFNFYRIIPYSAKNVLENMFKSRKNNDLIYQIVSDMITNTSEKEDKTLVINSNELRLIVSDEIILKQELQKIRFDEYMKSYEKLKEYLLDLHNQKKNLKEEELKRKIVETYDMEINNLKVLRDNLELRINMIKKEREEDIKCIVNFEKEFFNNFNLTFNINKKTLYNEIHKSLRNSNGVIGAIGILKKIFTKIYDDSLKNINNFVQSNEFVFSTEEKLEELEFFIDELINASHNSIQGIWDIQKNHQTYLQIDTIDMLIPDEQYKKVLEKFYSNVIEQLKGKIASEADEKVHRLKRFLEKIECILSIETHQYDELYDTISIQKQDKIFNVSSKKNYFNAKK